jgi:hypothetical protein
MSYIEDSCAYLYVGIRTYRPFYKRERSLRTVLNCYSILLAVYLLVYGPWYCMVEEGIQLSIVSTAGWCDCTLYSRERCLSISE